jgi:uncharacterized protein
MAASCGLRPDPGLLYGVAALEGGGRLTRSGSWAFVSPTNNCYISPMNSADILSTLKNDDALVRLGVASLRLFGSAARNTAGPGSDADFLVRFKGAATYDRYMDLKFHLEKALGIPVDLVTEDALRPEMREAVEREALLVA